MDLSKMSNGKTGKQFTSDELQEALFTIEDLMDQLLTPYFLLGKTAECVKSNKLLEGDRIDIGIRDKSLTQYVYDILTDQLKLTPNEVKKGFEYQAVNGVPIRVKVYTRDYYFFKYPNHVVYYFGTYQLPNPFDVYWKSRFLIR